MKFLEVVKSKSLKLNVPVFTVNADGVHGIAKLISKTEDVNGIKHTFEIPQFFDKDKPAIAPVLVSNITHVAIINVKKIEE